MFRSLLVNTLISTLAFFIVSVIGLLLVPLLIGAYGLTEFGLIVLARLLLPTGLLGVLDFGFGEVATQAVARARVDGDWRRAAGQVSLLLFMALAVGLVLALALGFGAELVTSALRIDAGYQQSFDGIVRHTGLCLVLVFPGLVLEGVVKGFEAFRDMRACEVLSTLIYAGGAVVATWIGAPYTLVVYVFMASLAVRTLLALMLALRWARGWRLLYSRWSAADRDEVMLRCRLMFVNKVLGTLHTQAAPMLIGVLLGAAAVGVYDVLVRLPRFVKSILGPLNSALLPVAARLEAASDSDRMKLLNGAGLIAIAALVFPPLMAGAVFSEPILRWWIGAEFERFWPWQAAMFLVPALNVLVSYGATSLLVRPHVVATMNGIVSRQLMFQFSLALALLPWWQERAFIFGQIVAVALTFVAQMRLIWHEHQLDGAVLRPLLLCGGVVGMLVAGSFLAEVSVLPQGPLSLVGTMLLWIVSAWTLLCLTLPSAEQRSRLLQALRPAALLAKK